jgi:hypothetical protein
MYMEEEAFRFFKCLIEDTRQSYKILILSHDNQEHIKAQLKAFGIPETHYVLKRALRTEVPDYISAADFGFVAVRQRPGKRFCSPIKDGEYWSCGLPLLIPDGISDDYLLAEEHNIGIRIKDDSPEAFQQTLNQMNMWMNTEDTAAVRLRCREFALKDRSVEVYQAIYRDIFKAI